MTAQPQHDQWAAWLFQRRHDGDVELLRHHLEADLPEFDPPAWVFSAWIKLTDKGERVARASEEDARGSHT